MAGVSKDRAGNLADANVSRVVYDVTWIAYMLINLGELEKWRMEAFRIFTSMLQMSANILPLFISILKNSC